MTAGDKDIKNKEDILTLLDAAWEPEKGLQSYTAEDIKKRIPPPRRLGETEWLIRLLNKQPRAWG